MCTFDAPISRCEAMRCMVITDQTQAQCAAEHACAKDLRCPLAGCFTGVAPVQPAKARVARAAPSVRRAA